MQNDLLAFRVVGTGQVVKQRKTKYFEAFAQSNSKRERWM